MRQLKQKEIAQVRTELLKLQGGLCALCRQGIQETEAALDHDHKTGQIRGVLHRGCNALEGIIENSLARNRITPQRLANIMANFVLYQTQLKPILHPSHRTPEQRRERTKQLAEKRRQRKNNQKD